MERNQENKNRIFSYSFLLTESLAWCSNFPRKKGKRNVSNISAQLSGKFTHSGIKGAIIKGAIIKGNYKSAVIKGAIVCGQSQKLSSLTYCTTMFSVGNENGTAARLNRML